MTIPGTNDSNFSLLPAGCRVTYYFGATTSTYLASTTPSSGGVYALFCTTNMIINSAILYGGYSVRLLMENISGWTVGDTVEDADHNFYDTVKIGNQVWIASNFKCTTLNDGTPISNVTDNAAWASAVTPAYCVYGNTTLIEE